MSACRNHKETLMLDIFDELNQNRKTAWEQHLGNCSGCKAEKEAISRTVKITKTALETPDLGEFEAAAMRERVIRDLAFRPAKLRGKKRTFFFSRAFGPALVSACVLLIALGFMASRFLTGPENDTGNRLTASYEQLPVEDLDIIKNLDLLSDLDALNKLSKAIDKSQSQPHHKNNNVQGRNGHGKKPLFS